MQRQLYCPKFFFTGWGKIQHPGNMHHTLQQAMMPVISKSDCSALNTKSSGISVSIFTCYTFINNLNFIKVCMGFSEPVIARGGDSLSISISSGVKPGNEIPRRGTNTQNYFKKSVAVVGFIFDDTVA